MRCSLGKQLLSRLAGGCGPDRRGCVRHQTCVATSLRCYIHRRTHGCTVFGASQRDSSERHAAARGWLHPCLAWTRELSAYILLYVCAHVRAMVVVGGYVGGRGRLATCRSRALAVISVTPTSLALDPTSVPGIVTPFNTQVYEDNTQDAANVQTYTKAAQGERSHAGGDEAPGGK